MWTLLVRTKQKLMATIPVMPLAGLGVGVLADAVFLKPRILPLNVPMISPLMVTLKLKGVMVGVVWRGTQGLSVLRWSGPGRRDARRRGDLADQADER